MSPVADPAILLPLLFLVALTATVWHRVMHRFPVYVLSTLILWGMWGRFGWHLLNTA